MLVLLMRMSLRRRMRIRISMGIRMMLMMMMMMRMRMRRRRRRMRRRRRRGIPPLWLVTKWVDCCLFTNNVNTKGSNTGFQANKKSTPTNWWKHDGIYEQLMMWVSQTEELLDLGTSYFWTRPNGLKLEKNQRGFGDVSLSRFLPSHFWPGEITLMLGHSSIIPHCRWLQSTGISHYLAIISPDGVWSVHPK